MANVVLFHHALGRTVGIAEFARRLESAGHHVTAPDLYDGHTFDSIQAGVEHAQKTGFDEIIRRGGAAADAVPGPCVYVGFSLGVMPAQKLAQTRADALGAILIDAAVPTTEFGAGWPAGVALQMHAVENDPWGDVAVARQLAAEITDAELFVYPGSAHLAADSSFADYDAKIAASITARAIAFLNRWP